MDIDLHCHAKLSKKSAFNLKHFLKLQQASIKAGLQAIALTEHFNTRGFTEIYETLENLYHYRDDYYDIGGLKVFCGLEVDVQEGGHVLLIGKRDDVLNLYKELLPFQAKENFPSLKHLLTEAGAREMLKIGAHPFRNKISLSRLSGNLLVNFDSLELNGKDFRMAPAVLQLAASLNLPVTAGSDTHHWLQAGCVRNQLAHDCSTVNQIKDCIKKGLYQTSISPWIGLRLTGAGLAKKLLKELTSA
ncbi:MAG: PHP domain-containing protein [Peptococcaceae bacterium]